jgi:hypothetical protein
LVGKKFAVSILTSFNCNQVLGCPEILREKKVHSLELALRDVHHTTCRLLWQLKGDGCSRDDKEGNILDILKREALFKLILKAELYELRCLGLLLGEFVVCRNAFI